MWDTKKRPTFLILGSDEGEEFQMNGIDQLSNKITEGNFPS